MSGRSKKTRLLSLFLFVPAVALAAPHADPKMVELWSHMDEHNAWRGVQRAVVPRELKRAGVDFVFHEAALGSVPRSIEV